MDVSSGAPSTAVVTCENVSKRFAGREVVKAVNLTITRGHIHAIVGENGAGKSTLLGLISGRYAPDGGRIDALGRPLPSGRPADIRRLGIAAIYQELMMCPALSALENVYLGQAVRRYGFVDYRAMRARFLGLCAAFDIRIDPDIEVRSLPLAKRQVLEILRGAQANARVLLLDEPTAALAEHERESLYAAMRRLAERGTSLVFVSHNLDEVLALSDVISVMRDGLLIRTAPRGEWTKRQMIDAMVGAQADVHITRQTERPAGRDATLHVASVAVPGRVGGIDLSVRQGEIVGLWGLIGSGRTSFLRALAGLEPQSTGSMTIRGALVEWPRSVRAALARGIALIPEDRKAALVLGASAADNINLSRPDRGVLFRSEAEGSLATEVAARFGFDGSRIGETTGHLSGGNQQKVLLAKWAARSPSVLLVDEPTRGIDVAAKATVMRSLQEMAAGGMAIVVTSSELEEVIAISDRLLVFSRGKVVAEIQAGSTEYNVSQILRYGFRQVGNA